MSGDRYLVFGRTGWIGGKLGELLTEQGKTFKYAESRTYDRESLMREVEEYKPTHVLNAAGVTGRPNVDWCEDHRVETIRSNVIGTLIVADVCEVLGIYHMLFATGCIFEYDKDHVIGEWAILSYPIILIPIITLSCILTVYLPISYYNHMHV
jgi:dTDP-4-dehydrorhamnose reductase